MSLHYLEKYLYSNNASPKEWSELPCKLKLSKIVGKKSCPVIKHYFNSLTIWCSRWLYNKFNDQLYTTAARKKQIQQQQNINSLVSRWWHQSVSHWVKIALQQFDIWWQQSQIIYSVHKHNNNLLRVSVCHTQVIWSVLHDPGDVTFCW